MNQTSDNLTPEEAAQEIPLMEDVEKLISKISSDEFRSGPQFPELVVEIFRYDDPTPDTYRFFYLDPHAVSERHMNYRPFQTLGYIGFEKGAQNYIEYDSKQVLDPEAVATRTFLRKEGYAPIPFADLPLNLAHWVTHSKAPIEWHTLLDNRDPDWMWRVTVWVRGELPA